jgi:EAL domain-containing protein (putative c-di-GMP-specific phosphodiesterase class I)
MVGDDERSVFESVADAAMSAASDAGVAAQSAAVTTQAAQLAARETAEAADRAHVLTATTAASAAAATAQLAATTAQAVATEAADRAATVATEAAATSRSVAAALPTDADPSAARRAAALVADSVAADVVTHTAATAEAARMVAEAVAAAAGFVLAAATDAAASVELAATDAATSASAVATLSVATKDASSIVADSTARFADLAPLLGAVTSLHRATLAWSPSLVREMKAALAGSEFRLHYQPIYNMQTGAVVAVEALLRWQHATRGLLPPAEFLHVAESHPLFVNPIGDWVLTTAATQANAWREAGVGTTIWINVSCDQLGNNRLHDVVETLLHAGLRSSDIGVEVTERQLIEADGDAARDLSAVRELGVSLALDDFGTGYASLDYLRRFTFDEIKIDQAFVSGIGRDRTDTAVVSSIIELGRSLDLTVVAEGVETEAQYEHLKQLGCNRCQGYLLQRAASPEKIGSVLRELMSDQDA